MPCFPHGPSVGVGSFYHAIPRHPCCATAPDAGHRVAIIKIDAMDVNAYQHVRNVVKAMVTSLSTSLLTSVIYAMGNRPQEGLILTEWTFVLALTAFLSVLLLT